MKNRNWQINLGLALVLACMTLPPIISAQTTSGLYDFDYFGDSLDVKPINGLAPLSQSPENATVCSGWNNTNRYYPYWQGFSYQSNGTIADDDYSYPFDLGFSFNFYNSRYSQIKVSDNLYVSFDMTQEDSSPHSNTRIPNSAAPYDAIYLFWNNGHIYHGYIVDPVISYKTYGNEPGHRNTIIEFYEDAIQANNSIANYYTGWIRLYETTNIVELWYFKSQSSTCYTQDCDAEVGMEWGDGFGTTDTLFDEPPTNPTGDPDCTLSGGWYNNESWHNGPPDDQNHDGCETCNGNCIPPVHYRFIPKSYPFNAPAPNNYWPEDFEGLTDIIPDWWSITDEAPKAYEDSGYGNSWRYNPTYTGTYLSGGCMVTDPASSHEIITTRFVDFSADIIPVVSFDYEFVNDNGHNTAEVLVSIDGSDWDVLWTRQGSDSSGHVANLNIPQAAMQKYTQIAFRYTRDDMDPPIVNVMNENMDSDPGFTHGGAKDEWQYAQVTASDIQFYHFPGPYTGYDGDYFYALDSGNDNYGSYNNNCATYLDTYSVDCSGLQYVEASFYRWLGVERAPRDIARFQVSNDGGTTWNTVWTNETENINFGDTAWVLCKYDISAFAAGQSNVMLRWYLQSDSSNVSYGWNIDNVRIDGLSYSPAGYFAIDNVSFDTEPTPTPSATPTDTGTPTPTNTATPTITPTPTDTPFPSNTPNPSFTATPTSTYTNPATPSYTPTTNETQTPTDTPTPLPSALTQTPTPIDLNCINVLNCGEMVYADPLVQGHNEGELYPCIPGILLDGDEIGYSFTAPEDGTYEAFLFAQYGHMVIMLMDDCNAAVQDCQWSTHALQWDMVAGQTVYIVVDAPLEYQVPFSLRVTCPSSDPLPSMSHEGLVFSLIVFGFLVITSTRKTYLKNRK